MPKSKRASSPKTPNRYRVVQSDMHPREFNIDRYDKTLKIWRYVGLIRADDDVVKLVGRLLNTPSRGPRKGK